MEAVSSVTNCHSEIAKGATAAVLSRGKAAFASVRIRKRNADVFHHRETVYGTQRRHSAKCFEKLDAGASGSRSYFVWQRRGRSGRGERAKNSPRASHGKK